MANDITMNDIFENSAFTDSFDNQNTVSMQSTYDSYFYFSTPYYPESGGSSSKWYGNNFGEYYYFNENSSADKEANPWYSTSNSGVGNGTQKQGFKCSIWCDYSIYSEQQLGGSDIRIKKRINDISDNEALNIVRNIECKTYYYKDSVKRGFDQVYGYIAQQVKEVFPPAVKNTYNLINN